MGINMFPISMHAIEKMCFILFISRFQLCVSNTKSVPWMIKTKYVLYTNDDKAWHMIFLSQEIIQLLTVKYLCKYCSRMDYLIYHVANHEQCVRSSQGMPLLILYVHNAWLKTIVQQNKKTVGFLFTLKFSIHRFHI